MWKPREGRLTIMFSIGEFSKIAQVTKRQLRFYDEMGLLPPASVGENGRRFYSAKQLADLNRILALQQLGFALEQVRQLGQDDVPLEELRGMLQLKQAESERRLHEEAQRLRAIASRLEQIERSSREGPLNVVLKRLPEQRVLSVKLIASSLEEAMGLFRHVVRRFPEQAGVTYGHFFVRLLSDAFEVEALYGEIGRVITTGTPHATRVDTGLELAPGTLPAEAAVATFVVEGPLHDLHLGYAAIGLWVEANAYRLAGFSRETVLQLPGAADGSDMVTEVQIPVSQSGD
jgi:DNA-binding transcriptional MerR regulator